FPFTRTSPDIRYTIYLKCKGCICLTLFLFNDTATTKIYTLSLHDALPISIYGNAAAASATSGHLAHGRRGVDEKHRPLSGGCARSEEHTSELQSRFDLVCRLLLEKKKRGGVHF